MRNILAATLAGAVGFIGATTATALTNGTDVATTDAAAQGVVQVASCTGTVVASQWVLTAQHCVEVPDLQRTVYTGATREQQHRAENQYVADYAVWAPHGDVALVHVTMAFPEKMIQNIRRDAVEFGATGSVYGWGAGTEETLQFAQAAVGRTTPGIRPGTNEGAHDAFVVQYLGEAKAGRGDSGGPLFVDGEVAGVTSFKARQGGGRYSLFASLHGLGDWIAQTTATPAQPSTSDAPPETAPIAPNQNGPVAKPEQPSTGPVPPVAKPENPNFKNPQPKDPKPEQPRGPLGTPGGGGSSLGLSSS